MSDFDEIVAEIKQKRDELRVQIALGSMELKDEWAGLEKKLEHFDARAAMREAGEEIDEVLDEVLDEALEEVGEEIREAYEKIKKAVADAVD